MNGRCILFDLRETTDLTEKEIVGRVIIDLRNLADDGRAGSPLGPELVPHQRRERNGLARFQNELVPGLDALAHPVERNLDLRVGEFTIRRLVMDLANEIAPAPGDDVFFL